MQTTIDGQPLVYADNSALSRLSDPDPALVLSPLNRQRLAREADEVRQLVSAVELGRLVLLAPEVLLAEVLAAPLRVRERSLPVLALAQLIVPIAGTQDLAEQLRMLGFREADALHLAAASVGGAHYAVSCDDAHWLRRAPRVRQLLGLRPAIVSPGECLRREGLLR